MGYTEDDMQEFRLYADDFLMGEATVLRVAHTPDGEGGTTDTFMAQPPCPGAFVLPRAGDRVKFADAQWGPLTALIKLPYDTEVYVDDRIKMTGGYLTRVRDTTGPYQYGTVMTVLVEVIS